MEFKIEDTIVDTGKAAQKWDSRNTSSQGQDEKLYRSDQGRYYNRSHQPRAGLAPKR